MPIIDCSGLTGFPMVIMRVLCVVADFLFSNPLILGLLIVAYIIYRIIKKKS